MRKEPISSIEATAFYHYMIEYLLVSSDIQTDLANIDSSAYNSGFHDILQMIIAVDKEDHYFDHHMNGNMEYLLNYLKVFNPMLFIDIYNEYHSYAKKSEGNFYANQLFLKYDRLDDYANNQCISWNVEDMRNSVIYDFAVYAGLLNNDVTKYINEQFSTYTLDQRFLYLVRKITNQYPQLFEDKSFKVKVKAVLLYNSLLDSIEAEENMMKEFCIKNDIKTHNKAYRHKKYQALISDNDQLLKKIDNNQLYEEPCNIANYINAYNEVIVLNSLYKDGEIPKNALMLDALVRKIKNARSNEFTHENKKIFIDTLSVLRPYLGKDQIPIYNDCVGYINTQPTAEKNALNSRDYDISRLSPIMQGIIKLYQSLCEFKDIGDKNIYEALKDFFDSLNNKSSFKHYDLNELEQIINTFIRVYPRLMTNQDIYNKVEEALDLLPKEKKNKINCKIKKIRRVRKMS